MRTEFTRAILEAVKNHAAIIGAAITGSLARQDGSDEHSDLDLLLVTRDPVAVRKAPTWLPKDRDRKSTRLNSSHITISYAVFCLKKKKKKKKKQHKNNKKMNIKK